MQERLKKMLEEAREQLSAANTEKEAEEIRIRFLGKKGQITEVLRSMGKLAPEEKKEEEEHALPKCADNPFPDSLDTYPTLPKAPEYKPKMPYPQRLQKETKDKQFLKFLEVFRKL